MARLLTSPLQTDTASGRVVPGRWPVDLMIGGYLTASAALIAFFFRAVPDAGLLLAIHTAALLLMAVSIRYPSQMAVFRHWYPLPYVAACYKEMAILIPVIRNVDFDAQISELDYQIWGAHVSVWMERIHHPLLTEFLQAAYTLFIPCVLLVAAILWKKGKYRDFRYYAFLVALGFLASYIGYMLVPVRGPRFFLAHLQHFPLYGARMFHGMQRVLDNLEAAHFDCFPSGHTELTLIAWWSSRRISAKLFAAYSVYSLVIVFATVYLRYHYTIDVFAGAVLAAMLLVITPGIYERAIRPSRAEEDI
jgi:membrane-associated phospholipid phosphatase